jgi:hypothetical protein
LIFETGFVKNTGALGYVFGNLWIDQKRNKFGTSCTYRRVMARANGDKTKVLDKGHKIAVLSKKV